MQATTMNYLFVTAMCLFFEGYLYFKTYFGWVAGLQGLTVARHLFPFVIQTSYALKTVFCYIGRSQSNNIAVFESLHNWFMKAIH